MDFLLLSTVSRAGSSTFCHIPGEQLWDDITMSWTRIHWTIEAGPRHKDTDTCDRRTHCKCISNHFTHYPGKSFAAPMCMCKYVALLEHFHVLGSFAAAGGGRGSGCRWRWAKTVGGVGCLVSKAGHTRRGTEQDPADTATKVCTKVCGVLALMVLDEMK